MNSKNHKSFLIFNILDQFNVFLGGEGFWSFNRHT